MGKGTSKEEVWLVKVGDHVTVIENSEWEGLIGKIEEFMHPEEKTLHPEYLPGYLAIVFFPTLGADIRAAKMVGVNRFTRFVRQHLMANEGKQFFCIRDLEWFDPNDL